MASMFVDMLILFDPLGSLAFSPSTVAVVARPRWPEMTGRSVPKPSPSASMSFSFDVPGMSRSSDVMSRPFVEMSLIWSEVSRAVRSLDSVSTVAPEATVVTISVTCPTVSASSPSARLSSALRDLKTLLLDPHRVDARLDSGEVEAPVLVRVEVALLAGLLVDERHGGAHEHAARGVGHRARDVAGDGLRRGRAAQQQDGAEAAHQRRPASQEGRHRVLLLLTARRLPSRRLFKRTTKNPTRGRAGAKPDTSGAGVGPARR